MAILSGKNLIRNEQKINQLFIYERHENKFEFVKNILLADKKEFEQISMQFYFKNYTDDPKSIIFAKKDRIIELNLETEVSSTIAYFQEEMNMQPEFF